MATPVETSHRRRVGVPARGPARDGDPGRDGELPMEEEGEGDFLDAFRGAGRANAPGVSSVRTEVGSVLDAPGFRHRMSRAMSGMRSRRRVLLHAKCARRVGNRSARMANNRENIARG